jgi:hypothetical protein
MDDNDKKLLTEFLGECWHETAFREYELEIEGRTGDFIKATCSCGKVRRLGKRYNDVDYHPVCHNLDFTDWRVVGRLIEKAEDVEVWYFHEDKEWCARVLERETHSASTPQEAICAAVLAWLKEVER